MLSSSSGRDEWPSEVRGVINEIKRHVLPYEEQMDRHGRVPFQHLLVTFRKEDGSPNPLAIGVFRTWRMIITQGFPEWEFEEITWSDGSVQLRLYRR